MRRDGLKLTLLLDYYGELLTQKQRLYCDLYYNQDYSLAEIAEESGISRQGVHDSLLHAEAALTEFERIMGCAARDEALRGLSAKARETLAPLLQNEDPQIAERAQQVSDIITTMEGTAGSGEAPGEDLWHLKA